MVRKYRIPSENTHVTIREKSKQYPSSTLISKRYRIYKDSVGNIWYQCPWYDAITSKPWKYIKLVHYDNDTGDGSTSILVNKKLLQKQKCIGRYIIPITNIKKIKYNFKDKRLSTKWQHFIADKLPYCRNITQK